MFCTSVWGANYENKIACIKRLFTACLKGVTQPYHQRQTLMNETQTVQRPPFWIRGPKYTPKACVGFAFHLHEYPNPIDRLSSHRDGTGYQADENFIHVRLGRLLTIRSWSLWVDDHLSVDIGVASSTTTPPVAITASWNQVKTESTKKLVFSLGSLFRSPPELVVGSAARCWGLSASSSTNTKRRRRLAAAAVGATATAASTQWRIDHIFEAGPFILLSTTTEHLQTFFFFVCLLLALALTDACDDMLGIAIRVISEEHVFLGEQTAMHGENLIEEVNQMYA